MPPATEPARGGPEVDRRDGPDAAAWRRWGPYLADRAWGTVREDYSADGDAWASFPHDHARSRAYRWNEDGLGGICDDEQHLCLALALWNGADPYLKERLFGLTNAEGNHGEDAKEVWWNLDATPTASWLRWRYHYPQRAFPYGELVGGNAARGGDDPELEVFHTAAFDEDRYWRVDVTWAKAGPDDVCGLFTVANPGPEAATLWVLPTLWFRNTWSWRTGVPRPVVRSGGAGGAVAGLEADHVRFGSWELLAADGPAGPPGVLVCDNDTNASRLYGTPADRSPAFPKDGIGDHLVHGAPTVSPAGTGTKGSLVHRLDVAPGASVELRVRLRRRATPNGDGRGATPDDGGPDPLGAGFDEVLRDREAEADEFHRSLLPPGTPADRAEVARQAFAGLVWSRQFYNFDVDLWLRGDPTQPPPPQGHAEVRNTTWRHLNNHDVLAMPDSWEYPWYAAWDLAFHAVANAHIDPAFAKTQLLLLGREWYQHPTGQLPAYEWDFSDMNPPVQAWAALEVFEIDGRRDHDFLARVFQKLLINFTWWVNTNDVGGNNAFEGGFLGMDNVSAFDRSEGPPGGGVLEQADGTAWMAMFCLDMLRMALTLALHDPVWEDVATKFFEHFTYIAAAFDVAGLWDEEGGCFTDMVRMPDGRSIRVPVRSVGGIVPMFAVMVLSPEVEQRLPGFASRLRWFLDNRPEAAPLVGHLDSPGPSGTRLLSVLSPDRLRRVLSLLLDEDELLSPHGIRSLSRRHLAQPAVVRIDDWSATVDYEPAESRTRLFGGNSNWRGPVWFPVNLLAIGALRRFHAHFGDDFTVELPSGSGRLRTLGDVADDLSGRLVALFTPDHDGRRPCFGDSEVFQRDPAWRNPWFHEYFNGDDGAGLGASHQTGWTALVADLVVSRRPPA